MSVQAIRKRGRRLGQSHRTRSTRIASPLLGRSSFPEAASGAPAARFGTPDSASNLAIHAHVCYTFPIPMRAALTQK
jgi:hypothetical protein